MFCVARTVGEDGDLLFIFGMDSSVNVDVDDEKIEQSPKNKTLIRMLINEYSVLIIGQSVRSADRRNGLGAEAMQMDRTGNQKNVDKCFSLNVFVANDFIKLKPLA